MARVLSFPCIIGFGFQPPQRHLVLLGGWVVVVGWWGILTFPNFSFEMKRAFFFLIFYKM